MTIRQTKRLLLTLDNLNVALVQERAKGREGRISCFVWISLRLLLITTIFALWIIPFLIIHRKRRVNLKTSVPGANWRSFLSTFFPQKVFDRVFLEPISDVQVEYLVALSEGKTRHASWIVVRGHMIILATLGFYVYSSTIGKFIRDLLNPTSLSD